jgi:hypothetical protein
MSLIPGNTNPPVTLPWASAPVKLAVFNDPSIAQDTTQLSATLQNAQNAVNQGLGNGSNKTYFTNYNDLYNFYKQNLSHDPNDTDYGGLGQYVTAYNKINSDLQNRNTNATQQNNLNQATYNVDLPFSKTFTPSYFNTKLGSYLSTYTPQLNNQYNNLQKDSYYQLARQGLYGTPQASEVANRNQVQYATQQNNLNSLGQNYVNGLEADVLHARNAILPSSADSANPTQSATDAKNAIANLTQQQANPTFSPLGNLFTLFSNAQGNSGNNGTFFNTNPSVNPLTSQIFKQNAGGQAGKVVTG